MFLLSRYSRYLYFCLHTAYCSLPARLTSSHGDAVRAGCRIRRRWTFMAQRCRHAAADLPKMGVPPRVRGMLSGKLKKIKLN